MLTLDKLTHELADNAELFEMSKEDGDETGLLTIEAEAETRAYAAAYRDIRARGWFTAAQLRALGFPAPRTKPRRPKPGP